MKEYIEREAALEILKRNPIGTWRGAPVYSEEIKSAADEIRDLPAADVAEVRHGRWITVRGESSGLNWKCSLCAKRILQKSPYCPNCGALMKEEEHDYE